MIKLCIAHAVRNRPGQAESACSESPTTEKLVLEIHMYSKIRRSIYVKYNHCQFT